MVEKVWVIYREEDNDKFSIHGDKVYLNEKKADRIAKELNEKYFCEYWVDCLDVD